MTEAVCVDWALSHDKRSITSAQELIVSNDSRNSSKRGQWGSRKLRKLESAKVVLVADANG